MPTTSNFGWTTPADTDLVKDGAAAIRTLGNGIDTSFLDLKGGTTGQVLSKASNTDLDFTWTSETDPTAIQKTIIDAKGDLISATAADTPARLAVGTNGQVLTADSTQSTGLAWTTISSGGMTLLSTTTLSGASTTISGISGSYTNLQIIIYGVTQSANTFMYIRPNGSSGIVDHSYFYRLSGNQSDINGDLLFIAGPMTAANADNSCGILIYNYASSVARKPFTCDSHFRDNSTAARSPQTGGGGINTTSAISSLLLAPSSGTFNGGTVLVYGVK